MHRIASLSLLFSCGMAGLLPRPLPAQPRLIHGPIQDSVRARITGHVHPFATPQNDTGALDDSTLLPAVTLVLRLSDAQQADLDTLLAAQQDPASADYHHWLTPEQFADRFGASTSDIAAITAWVEQHNLHVTNVARARNAISFAGTAGDVAKAFQVSFHRYSVNGREHFANTAAPSLPVALQAAVRSIHGLHDFRMEPRAQQARTLSPDYTSTSGNHYLSPDDLGTLYNIKALWNAGYNGSGQKIAIAGQTQVDVTDIQKFRAKFLLPASDPQMTLVPNTRDPGVSKGDLGEADLDLEWAGATAPQATLLYIYSYDVTDAVQYIIDQNLAPVLSVSYGLCEPQSLPSDMLTMQTWARQGNAQGMTWINASGDSGAADCLSGTSGGGLAVDSPADVPEVTGIGGTTFTEGSGQYWNSTTNANGGSVTGYIPEAVWNDSTSGNPAAGGGGASTQFTQPTWQTGLGVPKNGARNVPDLALAASANHDGYLVYSTGQLQVYGGTSAGTPAFAGMTALLNHYLVSTGAQSTPGVGNINPRLYALAQAGTGAFHDVTTGDNSVTVTCGPRSRNCVAGTWGYTAGQGYDQASGLGSVDAYNLVTGWRTGLSTARAAASVDVKASATSLTATDSVTVTATVTASSGTTPTGTVTFLSGTKQIGIATLNGSGASATATITVSAAVLNVGSNSIVAQYSGDIALNAASATATIAVSAASGPPTISGIAHGASFTQKFAPGMVLSIFGANLASATWVASSVPLPTQASSTTVTIAGVKAPLYYASASQLNVQIPYETPVGQTVSLSVAASGGTATITFTVSPAAPGIFTDSTGAVVPTSTAKRGSVVTLFVTGTGANSPAIATGAAPAASTPIVQLPAPVQSSSVSIGGAGASIQFIGIPSGLVGVTQLNVTIPANAPVGKQSLIVTIGGIASAPATLNVQ